MKRNNIKHRIKNPFEPPKDGHICFDEWPPVFFCFFFIILIEQTTWVNIERTFLKRPRPPSTGNLRVFVDILLYLLTSNYLNEQKFKQQEVNIEHEKISKQLYLNWQKKIFIFIFLLLFKNIFHLRHSCSVILETQNPSKFEISSDYTQFTFSGWQTIVA